MEPQEDSDSELQCDETSEECSTLDEETAVRHNQSEKQYDKEIQNDLQPEGSLKEEDVDSNSYNEDDLYSSLDIVCVKEEPEDDENLYCEQCQCFFFKKCDLHGSPLFIPDSPVPMGVSQPSRQTLPAGLEIRGSGVSDIDLAVYNKGDTVPVGAYFGPYQGEVVEREEALHSIYSWVIYKSGHEEEFIDATSEISANWMRYVKCARSDEEHNLVVFQYRGGIYYRCCRPIQPGHELLMWYSEEYDKDLSSTFNLLWNNKITTNGMNDTQLQVFCCSICPLSYASQIYLHKHIRRFHYEEYMRLLNSGEIQYENLASKKSLQSSSGGVYTPSCDRMTPSRDQHCSDCGKRFSRSCDLQQHRCGPTGEKPYQCGECGKSFNQQGHLQRHQRTHTGEKPYQCTLCGKSFVQENNLKTHYRVHTGEKPYNCPQCGRSFAHQSTLHQHQRIHTGEKPYQCGECGKCFNRERALQQHQRIHTKEQPYQCMQCGKSFTFQRNLQTHERIHSGEKPYSCLQCGKSFNDQSTLQRHKRIHTGEKPYRCSQCGRSFNQHSALQRHQRIHTGEKPYHCPRCGKSFTHSVSQKRHKCDTAAHLSVTEDLQSIPEALDLSQKSPHDRGLVPSFDSETHSPLQKSEDDSSSLGYHFRDGSESESPNETPTIEEPQMEQPQLKTNP